MKRSNYCCYSPVEPHQWPHHPLIFYFFSLLKLLFSLFFKKKKKKHIFFSLLVHIYCYTFPNLFISSNILFPFCLFIFPLLFTLPLHFIIFFLIFWLFFSPVLFLCKFNIISLIQSIFFLWKNCECSLSLSLSRWIFVLSYNFD